MGCDASAVEAVRLSGGGSGSGSGPEARARVRGRTVNGVVGAC